ncbi:major capsid protein (plasmid) [Rhodococcus sp. DMF-1]|uniref:major capsid protein n=1 Tax=Rhodococcus sp. DMF-1 TaxID=2907624 RepID=UPI001F1806E2|nr:major capsid protein [Rhodococcus sp. DMF-1]UIR39781.1 major capsid protein [Rhodococcus sp. DMF-1]
MHHDQVDDAYIDRCFAIRKARVQWVSDWQTSATGLPGVAGGILAFPSTIQFVAYPAGTWVRAVEDVIELGTVHDTLGCVSRSTSSSPRSAGCGHTCGMRRRSGR